MMIGGIASSIFKRPIPCNGTAIIILMFYSRGTAYKLLGLSFGSLILLAMVSPVFSSAF
jgi:hypothetical protein